jgi:hypothetical protein
MNLDYTECGCDRVYFVPTVLPVEGNWKFVQLRIWLGDVLYLARSKLTSEHNVKIHVSVSTSSNYME